MSTAADIVERVCGSFPEWGDSQKIALSDLVGAVADHGYLPNATVAAALEHFLDVVDMAQLKEEPARGLVDNFLSTHPDHARRLFFKKKKLLDPQFAEEIRSLFGERLMIDLWPVALPESAPPQAHSASTPAAGFGEADYQLFVAQHFGRDRTFLPDTADLYAAIDRAEAELQQRTSELSTDERTAFSDRLEREFLASLREMIAALERGENPPAFHFMT